MNLKTILLATGLFAGLTVNAQTKLGTNPITLNGDALLELESSNRGLLMTRLALSSTASASPLSAHVPGMTVYNTATAGDVAPGFYFDNGTRWVRIANSVSSYASTASAIAATPSAAVDGNIIYDQSCGCAKLYTGNAFVSLNDNAHAQTFNDTTAANNAVPTAKMMGNIIFDLSNNGLKLYNGSKWITPGASPVNYIFADTNAANAFNPNIRVQGQQILDNSCACLKVFNNGWKLASGGGQANSSTAFSAGLASNGGLLSTAAITLSLGGGASSQVNFTNEEFDNGDVYTTTSADSRFTAPFAGVYHFDVGILTSITVNVLGNYNVYLVVGNTVRYSQPLNSVGVGGGLSLSTEGQANFGRDLNLSAGDNVRVFIGNTGLASLGVTLVQGGTFFNGHLVK